MMMVKKKMLLSILGVVSSLFIGIDIVTASPLTWKLTGEVETVGSPLTHIFSIGDKVEYTFTFETLTPDSNASPIWGNYINTILAGSITVGSYSATISNYGIQIINNSDWGGQPEDMIGFHLQSADTVLNGADIRGSDNLVYRFVGLEGSFDDQDGSPGMLSSDSLPNSPYGINNQATRKTFYVCWEAWLGGVYLGNGISTKNIQLTDITPLPPPPDPVPEPATMLLLGTGIAGLAGSKLRRKKQ